jgi:hypothetical protein
MFPRWYAWTVMTLRSKRSGALPILFCALGLAVLSACVPTRPYATLSAAAEPLRSQFNKDVGQPRIMMLVAPT